MQQYRTVNGILYERKLLDAADKMQGSRKKGGISLREAKRLYVIALDYGFVTEIERRTLVHIIENYGLTKEAAAWLSERVEQETPMQRAIKRTIREAADFPNMQWQIDDAEAEAQEAMNTKVPFLNALFEVLDTFLHQMESSYSPRDIISEELDLDLEEHEFVTEQLRAAMDEGTIYLFPRDYQAAIKEGRFPLQLQDFTNDFKEYWMFGLTMPSLPNYEFTGYIRRSDAYDTYTEGWAIGGQPV